MVVKQATPKVVGKHTYKLYPSASTTALIECIALLVKKPHCKNELLEATGVSQATLVRWFRAFDSRKLVYVAMWKKTSTVPVAYYMFGHPVNSAPKPAPKTSKEYSKDYRMRIKSQIEKEKSNG